MGNLFQKLKNRKAFRIAAFTVETFAAPQWMQQIFVVFLILGFPLAIVLAWAYEVTPSGVQADSGSKITYAVSPCAYG
ncbi:MAG: hypothetical protein JKY98_11665 [Gammaproteobacteria bacterium]|nr:hypothetical protein [Gammaproteobacteria bacterium]